MQQIKAKSYQVNIKYDFYCEGNLYNNTPSNKSNHGDSEDKMSDRNNSVNQMSQNESGTMNRKTILIIGDSILRNIEG